MNKEETYPKFYLYNRIVKAKLFIDQNFEQAIDLNNIANEALFSKFHFIRLFSAVYGRTPRQYLIHVRLANAKKDLEHGFTISETCFRVGFSSVSSFSGLFKKVCKQSPTEYQRLYKRREETIKQSPLQFIPGCFAAKKGWK